jgi:YebC/PmpR family DNA-binding regulatory protein
MSGHSKWHNIQRTKGAADTKRAQIFTKIAREIIVAVRESGGDPSSNSRLAAVVAKAKAANIPGDNIKRTIEKALGNSGGENYTGATYEGYGPGGVAVIVEAMTDNRNRTAADVRHCFDKYGGNMGASGCVSWSFDRKSVFAVANESGSEDEDRLIEIALEAGADDVQTQEDVFVVYAPSEAFGAVNSALDSAGYRLLSAQTEMVPRSYISLTSPDDIKNMEKLLELLEASDDVQNVWHNFE